MSRHAVEIREASGDAVVLRDTTPRARRSRSQLQTPDSAWSALEARVAAQVAGLQKTHSTERVNAERAQKAMISQLEARVSALEGQTVRADRRASELAGMAKALTEEQRALLIRLDRLEDYQQRSLQQRQQRRQRRREEPSACLWPTEDWTERNDGGSCSPWRSGRGAAALEPQPQSLCSSAPAGLGIASLRDQWGTARVCNEEDVRLPCEGFRVGEVAQWQPGLLQGEHPATPTKGGVVAPSWVPGALFARVHELESSLVPRTDAIEAKAAALAQSLEDLQGAMHEALQRKSSELLGDNDTSHRGSRSQQKGNAMIFKQLSQRATDQQRWWMALEELRTEVSLLRTNSARVGETAVATATQASEVVTSALQTRVEAQGVALEEVKGSLQSKRVLSEARFATELEEMQKQLVLFRSGCAATSNKMQTTAAFVAALSTQLQEHTFSIEDLRSNLRSLQESSASQGKCTEELGSIVPRIRSSVDAGTARCEANATAIAELSSQLQGHLASMEELRSKVEIAVGSSAAHTNLAEGLDDVRTELSLLRSTAEEACRGATAAALAIAEGRSAEMLDELRRDLAMARKSSEEAIQRFEVNAAVVAKLHLQSEEQNSAISDVRGALHALQACPTDQARSAKVVDALQAEVALIRNSADIACKQGEVNAAASAELASQLKENTAAVAELRAGLQSLQESSAGQVECTKAVVELEAEVAFIRSSAEIVSRRGETNSATIAELAARLQEQGEAVSELRSDCQATSARQVEGLQALEQAREELSLTRMGCNEVAREASDLEAVAELRAHVQESLQEASRGVSELRSTLRPLQEATEALRTQVTTVRDSLAVTSARSVHSADAIAELQARLQDLPAAEAWRAQQAALESLRAQLEEAREVGRPVGARVTALSAELAALQRRLASAADEAPRVADLADGLRDLHTQCTALQEALDQRVMVSLWRVDRQLPEALEKVDRISSMTSEQAAKIQEHDVRFEHALARISTHEQKVQGCVDRLEALPGLGNFRVMWQEEIQRRLEEADVPGLSQRVQLQSEALDELDARVQNMHDRIAVGGAPLTARGAAASMMQSPARGQLLSHWGEPLARGG